jgi:NAD(P)-dependent dehydrogenase (short-subunit alcohol dehydrogenase family)
MNMQRRFIEQFQWYPGPAPRGKSGVADFRIGGILPNSDAVGYSARSEMPADDDVLVVSGDIAEQKTAERAISQGLARFGRIDTLINNAGIFISKPFTQYTDADYTAMLGVNLAGFFLVTQFAIAEMEKRRSGHIVQITTSLVDHADSRIRCVLTSLPKGGLAAATRSLAIDYARRGIRVNAVSPGHIRTPLHPATRVSRQCILSGVQDLVIVNGLLIAASRTDRLKAAQARRCSTRASALT